MAQLYQYISMTDNVYESKYMYLNYSNHVLDFTM